jgi:hypothetical protein
MPKQFFIIPRYCSSFFTFNEICLIMLPSALNFNNMGPCSLLERIYVNGEEMYAYNGKHFVLTICLAFYLIIIDMIYLLSFCY